MEFIADRPEQWVLRNVLGISLIRYGLQKLYPDLCNIPVNIPIHPDWAAVGRSVSEQLPDNIAWVHVRRGDRLEQTGKGTSSSNIAKTLRVVCPKIRNIYIATDEREPGFFKPLESDYTVFNKSSFSALSILEQQDNYRLFLAERALGGMLPWRISTLKTKNPYCHGWLCNSPGYQ